MLLKPNYTKFNIDGRLGNYTYNKKGFNYAFMGMLSQIKTDIRMNVARLGGIDKLPNYTHKNIRYCFYGKQLTRVLPEGVGKVVTYRDAVEFDISKAYFKAALNLGYISEHVYERCTDERIVPKKDRLKLLGAIATQGELFRFVNGKEVGESRIISDEALRRVWFHICKLVDDCLVQFSGAVKHGLYMYWVDGAIFKSECLKEAESFMLYAAMRYNLEFKKVIVHKIEIKHNASGALCIYVHKENGVKEFMFPLGSSIKK